MISIKIEKEIKHDNKILAGLTMRQLLAVLAAGTICITIWMVTRMDINALLPAFLSIGCIAGVLGWVKKDGLAAEDYAMRYLKRIIYKNGRLKYRTSNAYVRLFNSSTKTETAKPKKAMTKAEKAALAKQKKTDAKKEKEYARNKMKSYA